MIKCFNWKKNHALLIKNLTLPKVGLGLFFPERNLIAPYYPI